MASFTNYATLSYNGGITNSNTVNGELLELITATKTAVENDYTAQDDVTYVLSLINSGKTAVADIIITDDLGAYTIGEEETTVYPLEYTENSLRYYINGVLQPTPTVSVEPPLVISDISIPAGGNAILIYETVVTEYAPLAADSTITNTATVTGGGIGAPIVATETIETEDRADLTISKAVCPPVVEENGTLTYTFIIANAGNTAATADDAAVLTDIFNPILEPITVTFNGETWVNGTNYNYNNTTGEFSTVRGQITVPAATYTQNEDGTWTVTPGTSTLVVTGRV